MLTPDHAQQIAGQRSRGVGITIVVHRHDDPVAEALGGEGAKGGDGQCFMRQPASAQLGNRHVRINTFVGQIIRHFERVHHLFVSRLEFQAIQGSVDSIR